MGVNIVMQAALRCEVATKQICLSCLFFDMHTIVVKEGWDALFGTVDITEGFCLIPPSSGLAFL